MWIVYRMRMDALQNKCQNNLFNETNDEMKLRLGKWNPNNVNHNFFQPLWTINMCRFACIYFFLFAKRKRSLHSCVNNYKLITFSLIPNHLRTSDKDFSIMCFNILFIFVWHAPSTWNSWPNVFMRCANANMRAFCNHMSISFALHIFHLYAREKSNWTKSFSTLNMWGKRKIFARVLYVLGETREKKNWILPLWWDENRHLWQVKVDLILKCQKRIFSYLRIHYHGNCSAKFYKKKKTQKIKSSKTKNKWIDIWT